MQKTFWRMWDAAARLKFYWRWSLKIGLFVVVLFFVLNPNPVLFLQQLFIYANVEQLIQTDFAGLEDANREIDAQLPANATTHDEFLAVQRYVYEKIPYAYDWDNWGNVDYWPTAAQVWQRKREDCDGRAVLAVSILRSRGFPEATLAGNFRHIWVTVGDEGLMSPDKEQNLRREHGKTIITLPSLSMILQNFAIYWADFPVARNLLLFLVIITLVSHPCRELFPFLGMMIAVLIGYLFMKDWAHETMRFDEAVITKDLVLGTTCMIGALLYSPYRRLSCRKMLNLFKQTRFHSEKLPACATIARCALYPKGDADGRTTTGTAARPTK